MAIQSLPRVFVYNSKEIQDINPSFTEEEVIKFLSGTYPQILNARIEKREVKDDKLFITISQSIGLKG